eukprot:4506559-Amphidinium_carterae.3
MCSRKKGVESPPQKDVLTPCCFADGHEQRGARPRRASAAITRSPGSGGVHRPMASKHTSNSSWIKDKLNQ